MISYLKTALASAGGFVGGYCVPTLAFLLVYYLSPHPGKKETSTLDDLITFFYFAGAYALAGALAYALIASAARNWRARPPRQIAGVSAIWGAVAQLLNWTGFALVPLMPFMHLLPRAVALVLGVAMSGVVSGAVIFIWSQRPPAKPASAP